MADEVTWSGGKLIHSKVTDKVNAKIEKGALSTVHAVVVHQTGGSTATSSLSSYDDGQNGAHFLIDTDGGIFQTARVDQKCWHVGQVRSRCKELKVCSADELKAVDAILFKKGESYAVRVQKLHEHEATKSYPDRYPTNEDSLGIEIVGAFDAKAQAYVGVSREQNDALGWLLAALTAKFGVGDADVYRHGTISYKDPSEASTATWGPKP